MKKCISLLMSVIMLLSILPAFSLTASAKSYKLGEIIEFGTYPQEKVTNSSLISSLKSVDKIWSSYDWCKKEKTVEYSGYSYYDVYPAGYERYSDFTYGGSKYRVYKCVGYTTYNSNGSVKTEHPGSEEVYYKFTPIKWVVLLGSDSSKLNLLSYNCLFRYPFMLSGEEGYDSSVDTASNWSISSIRKYLNSKFYNVAFTPSQQNKIAGVERTYEYYLKSNTSKQLSGKCTDKVSLVKPQEIKGSETFDYSLYVGSDGEYYMYSKDYNSGDFIYGSGTYTEEVYCPGYGTDYCPGKTPTIDSNVTWCTWLTRSAKSDYTVAAPSYSKPLLFTRKSPADSIGYTNQTQSVWDNREGLCGVRPYITLVNYTGGSADTATADYMESSPDVGETFYYGNYPQSEVTQAENSTEYNKVKETASYSSTKWKSYRYYSGTGTFDGTMEGDKDGTIMEFADFYVSSQGKKYRAVKIHKYRPQYTYDRAAAGYSNVSSNGYTTTNTYYFRYEPLKWRVVDPVSGEVVCDSIIDSQAFQNTVNRKEIDGKYYNLYGNAANNWNYSSIKNWLNYDFKETAFNTAQENNIKADSIALLKDTDVETGNGKLFTNAESRIAYPTAYAKAQGVQVNSKGASPWITVSPSSADDTRSVFGVNGNGKNSSRFSYGVNGIRPSMKLNQIKIDTSINNDSLLSKSYITWKPVVNITGDGKVYNYTGAEWNNATAPELNLYEDFTLTAVPEPGASFTNYVYTEKNHSGVTSTNSMHWFQGYWHRGGEIKANFTNAPVSNPQVSITCDIVRLGTASGGMIGGTGLKEVNTKFTLVAMGDNILTDNFRAIAFATEDGKNVTDFAKIGRLGIVETRNLTAVKDENYIAYFAGKTDRATYVWEAVNGSVIANKDSFVLDEYLTDDHCLGTYSMVISSAATPEVVLIAVPDEGYRFAGWYNAKLVGMEGLGLNYAIGYGKRISLLPTLTVTPDEQSIPNAAFVKRLNVIPKFEKIPETVNVTLNKSGDGSGTVTGGGTVPYQDEAIITATPDNASIFAGWYQGSTKVSDNAAFKIYPENDVTYTAKFEKKTTYKVTVNIEGNGSVKGDGEYPVETNVALTAEPASGNKFDGWYYNGTKISSDKKLEIFLLNDETVTAKFVENSAPSTPTEPSNSGEEPISTLAPGQATKTQVINYVTSLPNDNDPEGSSFEYLLAGESKVTKNSIKLKWKKPADASYFIVFGNRCGKKNKYESMGIYTGNSATFKKLKKGKYYKFIVCAFDSNDKLLGSSVTCHITTKGNKKYTNAKKVTTKGKKKLTLKKGKSFKLKGKQIPKEKKKKIANHRKVRYKSTNPSVAAVNAKGVIKAKKKGSCVVYAYAQNGVYKKVNVKVK